MKRQRLLKTEVKVSFQVLNYWIWALNFECISGKKTTKYTILCYNTHWYNIYRNVENIFISLF